MEFKGKFFGFHANNEKIGNPEDEKADLYVACCMPTMDGMNHYSRDHVWTTTSIHVKYVANCIGENTYLDYGRNHIVETAMEIGRTRFNRMPDYYLWIDQDNVVPGTLFLDLLKHNRDIVGGLYPRKVKWDWCLKPTKEFKDWENRRESLKDGLIECEYIGFGAVLIKGQVFEKMKGPYYFKQDSRPVKVDGKNRIKEIGEDVYFCEKARELGLKVWCDTNLHIGHTGATIWPEDAFAFHKAGRLPSQEKYRQSIGGTDKDLEK